MRRLRLLVTLLLLATTSTGCASALYNFGSVERAQIYRSAQPSPLLLRWLVAHHGIRTLINLRGKTPGFESSFAASNRLRLYTFNLSASRPPQPADVERFLALLRDPANYPLLVHCRNGVDRTGYMLGLYRVLEQGWSAEQSTAEMRRYWQFSTLNGVPQQVVLDARRVRAEPAR